MNTHAPLKIIGLENCWENVHPDVVHLPQGFAGYPYWMAFTPYPLMNDHLENPIIRASSDGMQWQRVPRTPDPLVPPPNNPEMHNADPELVYHEGRLHLVYLTIQRKTDETIFNAMSCGSDLRWDKPKVIHEDIGTVSPTFQIEGNIFRMWFIRVNAENLGRFELVHREGSDLSSLGYERKCFIDIPKHVPWHVDILKVKDGYEALVTAFPRGTNNSRSKLFHLSSKDGLTFELSGKGPIIKPSMIGWDNMMIYRSSFLKEPDGTYRIWYSAASWGGHFGIGLLQGSLDSLREPIAEFAPLPRYYARFPGELDGWLRYETRRLLPSQLLSIIPTRFFRNQQR